MDVDGLPNHIEICVSFLVVFILVCGFYLALALRVNYLVEMWGPPTQHMTYEVQIRKVREERTQIVFPLLKNEVDEKYIFFLIREEGRMQKFKVGGIWKGKNHNVEPCKLNIRGFGSSALEAIFWVYFYISFLLNFLQILEWF